MNLAQSHTNLKPILMKTADNFMIDLDQQKIVEEKKKEQLLLQRKRELRNSKSQAYKKRPPIWRKTPIRWDPRLESEPMIDI